MKTVIRPEPAKTGSPYTPQSAEDAISHLERILSAEGACQLFNGGYWCARVEQVSETRGLIPQQKARLARLLESVCVVCDEEPSPGS